LYVYKNDNGKKKIAKRIEKLSEHKFRINRIIAEDDYPTIYDYLKQFENQLKNREDSGNHWTNLRNCAYNDIFEKDKIIYSEIVQSPQFHYDTEKYYIDATCFLMTGSNLKYLTAMLNSKLLSWAFKNFYAGGGLGATGYRYKKAFLKNLPIIKLSENEQKVFEELVTQIINLKKENIDTTILENKIDKLVYKLYELTEQEIILIEKW